MVCPFCEEKQYFSARYKKKSATISIIISPIFMFVGIFVGFTPISLFIALSILLIFIIVTPLTVELANEEEALF